MLLPYCYKNRLNYNKVIQEYIISIGGIRMNKDSFLLQPIKVGNKVSTNRFFINAMECCDADPEGNPSKNTYERYINLFKGNAGIIDLEAISITRENIARKDQLSIMPQNEKAIAKFVSELKEVNDKPLFIFQLTHSGELSSPTFSKRICPKQVPGVGGTLLTEEDVEKIIDGYVTAAKIAYNSGADGLDLKFCHGYLGTQMLRPFNDRKWKYGGSWENRSRFAYEIIERISKAINYDKNFILGSKVTMWEGIPGGQGTASPTSPIMDLTEPLALIKGLEERGASYVLQSAGSPTYTLALSQPDKRIPDYAYLHQYFTSEIKKVVKPETVVVGSAYSVYGSGNNAFLGVNKPSESSLLYWGEKNINEGIVDMIALGRQSLADPILTLKVEENREKDVHWCTACDHCLDLMIHQQNVGCATFNRPYIEAYKEILKTDGELTVHHT